MEELKRPMENGTLVTPEADNSNNPLEFKTVEPEVWSAFPDNEEDVVVISQENHATEPQEKPSSECAAVTFKRPRLDPLPTQLSDAPANLPHSVMARPIHPPYPIHPPSMSSLPPPPAHSLQASQAGVLFNTPYYITPFPPPNFVPTWKHLLPSSASAAGHSLSRPPPVQKIYRLSLLNVQEFTIEGISPRHDLPPTSIHGLRVPIRQITRHHGKAVYQSGKWRIPLAAYHDFAGYLKNDGATVHGIPLNQLQIASLERARLEKGYPTPEQLVEYGVPVGLAQALAPFQRGGVDFVREKKGRALIADDMGLGKTIQGVASMSMYWQEWPLLVLCPSGARYHWESEFQQWLGRDSRINQSECSEEDGDKNVNGDGDTLNRSSRASHAESVGPLLRDEQIHVLTSAKSPIFPRDDTKVVICSYGLSSVLIESGKLLRRQFRCAIVDESHMLKNKSTKRTSLLLPVLNATDRCVLLSGTPALAKPLELWPQLAILGTEQHGWGAGNEHEFIEKYVKNGSSQRSAELHTMLRGTVMIRRLKNDILKTLPRKVREKAEVHVIANGEQRTEFMNLLKQLRDSKGALGNLARIHQAELEHAAVPNGDGLLYTPEPLSNPEEKADSLRVSQQLQIEKAHATAQLNADVQQQWATGQSQIRQTIDHQLYHLDGDDQRNAMLQMEGHLRNNLRLYADEKMRAIDSSFAQQLEEVKEKEEQKRTSLLSRLYSLTGDVKIPLIVESLKRWLADPTKGKVCVFAHHLSVLDAIRDGVGLSNDDGENRNRFIRIDGSTLPKTRQEQITAFQTDLSIRVALLGITAAGVAVTLTASSTVWFAELFWTPAIMIQAEDRCHRIGQNAKVNCLYFVAKGTLDDVLWKLLEQKFRDLGEFVEGKEKLKLVVDTVYQGHHEFHASVFNSDPFDDSDCQSGDDDIDFSEEMQLDNDLYHDIEELGEEEKKMLHISDLDADDADNAFEPLSHADDDIDAKPTALDKISREDGLGKSENDAISLSDDESEGSSIDKIATSEAPPDRPTATITHNELLADCRVYRIVFGETRLGLDIVHHDGRIVVSNIRPERILQFGPNSKPGVGDILCGIDGQTLGLIPELAPTTAYLKALLYKHPVEVIFMEAPYFVKIFRMIVEKKFQKLNENMKNSVSTGHVGADRVANPLDLAEKPVKVSSNSELPMVMNGPQNDVIELLDND